jgi:hypothetical protein
MAPMLSLGLLVGFGGALPTAPPPRKIPALKCEVHLTGKVETTIDGKRYVWDAPDAADVTISNTSDADVDIGSMWGPAPDLDLRVKDPTGKEVKTEPLSSLLSVQSLTKHRPYILKPGKAYECGVSLLCMVPKDKKVAGTYKVKAVYTFKGKEYESDWVEVKWPGKKK